MTEGLLSFLTFVKKERVILPWNHLVKATMVIVCVVVCQHSNNVGFIENKLHNDCSLNEVITLQC